MSDSGTPAAVDLVRKRSRSNSPGATDSPVATKKSNLDPSGPSNLSTVEDDSKPALTTADNAAASPAGGSAEMQTDDVKPVETTPMVVDSELPANPYTAAAEGDATSPEAIAAAEAAAAAAATIQMRALIVTQDASIIIGKAGKNVNEIREKSGSKITITEAVPGNPERVMVIAGQLDAVSKVSRLASPDPRPELTRACRHLDWWCVVSTTSRLTSPPSPGLVQSPFGEQLLETSFPRACAHVHPARRFIIPNARMGSVIGKAGSKIKEIQEASGARLQASEALLPGSTEVRVPLLPLSLALPSS
jgi:heterogeneous nuclear rnp K-like protein 2